MVTIQKILFPCGLAQHSVKILVRHAPAPVLTINPDHLP